MIQLPNAKFAHQNTVCRVKKANARPGSLIIRLPNTKFAPQNTNFRVKKAIAILIEAGDRIKYKRILTISLLA
ncbi:hypothetical protein A6770_20090 [Nostoc minutum NIES-26]|uniref:Uncharacterized protein n=1 Tax=Nostoc minutum NIES-26 TaxID=1844469 RepID=A0A367R6K7_9NOSO|nr:hypothetical protein A6770_20090 [Nostoc minutum NIES-26]